MLKCVLPIKHERRITFTAPSMNATMKSLLKIETIWTIGQEKSLIMTKKVISRLNLPLSVVLTLVSCNLVVCQLIQNQNSYLKLSI